MDDSSASPHSGAPPRATRLRTAGPAGRSAPEPGSASTEASSPERELVRSPTSLLRLLVGLVVTAIGALITWRFANTAAAMNRDWEQLTHLLPGWIRAIPPLVVGLTLILVPVVVNVQLLRYRRLRLFGVVNLAALAAFAISEVAVDALTRQPPGLFPSAYSAAEGSVNDPLLAAFVAARGGGLLVLAGMGLMAVNTWKTFAMARSVAPQPVLAPDAADARA